MNIMYTLLSLPSNTPPDPPADDQIGGILKQIGDEGPNFTAIGPIIGIVVTLFGIVLALMVVGGFLNAGIGGLKWSFQGGNERGAAAARKGITHGAAVIGVVALFATIAGLAITILTAF